MEKFASAQSFMARYRSHAAERPVRTTEATILAIQQEIFAEAFAALPRREYGIFRRLWVEEGGTIPAGAV